MKDKQTVLDKIPRDKTLSFGCEVEYILSDGVTERGFVYIEDLSGDIEGYNIVTGGFQGNEYFIERGENFKILGHPPTIADLLMVLGETEVDEPWEMALRADGKFMRDWGEGRHEAMSFGVPMNPEYRTLLDIPESDPMWEQLSKII